jgi:hypothetical protein
MDADTTIYQTEAAAGKVMKDMIIDIREEITTRLGTEPTRVHVTNDMLRYLDAHWRDLYPGCSLKGSLSFLGMKPVWDAAAFTVS